MKNERSKMNEVKTYSRLFGRIVLSLFITTLALSSCKPEAPWSVKNVEINMSVETVSAGFIECSFSPSKSAYYFINVEKKRTGYNPMDHQKQFMTIALDSAYLAYLSWRHELLEEGAADIAPFSSHTLQYGNVHHFFTALEPDTEYWVYAFVVNPDKQKPEGKLYLTTVRTTKVSIVDIHFEYRVMGYWDYIYPVDTNANIYTRFPYLSATRDSLEIAEAGTISEFYFDELFYNMMEQKLQDQILYGVKATHNDGRDSYIEFEEGHTYYTAIVGWDGILGNNVIYKFTWTGENFEAYFTDDDYYNSGGENE